MEEVRITLAKWTDSQIILGNVEEWKKVRRNLGCKGEFKAVDLWMD